MSYGFACTLLLRTKKLLLEQKRARRQGSVVVDSYMRLHLVTSYIAPLPYTTSIPLANIPPMGDFSCENIPGFV